MAAPARVERLVVESALLRGNAAGDPATRELLVLVPAAYDRTQAPLPVLWMLPAYSSLGASFLNRGCFEEALDQRLARLLADGMPPMLLALPDCATRLGGSQYVNSATLGPYEDHFVRELVPLVDARFRTLGARGRGVAGKSSGGFGALHLALRHPGLFAAVACHSGDLGFDLCYPHDFPACANVLLRAGGVDAFLARFFAQPKHAADEFAAIATLALAAAYSPDPAQPGGLALPFEPQTCELRPATFARWLAFDPVLRVAAEGAALRRLALLFVDCGRRDEYHLHFGARRFVRACRAAGIAVEHEEFDDGHRGTSHRFDVSLPRLARALAAGAA